jgi:hypothetical protein
MRKDIGGNAYALILDSHHDRERLLVIRGRQGDRPPDIREGLTRILDEVDEHLFKAVRITS